MQIKFIYTVVHIEYMISSSENKNNNNVMSHVPPSCNHYQILKTQNQNISPIEVLLIIERILFSHYLCIEH